MDHAVEVDEEGRASVVADVVGREGGAAPRADGGEGGTTEARLPPSAAAEDDGGVDGGGAPTVPSEGASRGRRRRPVAAAAASGLLCAAGLGLGLGLGLGSGPRGGASEGRAGAEATMAPSAGGVEEAGAGVDVDEGRRDHEDNYGAADEAELEAAEEPELEAEAEPEEYDAVIVGAGWAGLRALEILLSSGASSVLVLEASPYVGGRSRSLNLDGTINDPSKVGDESSVPYDVGSMWLYPRSGQEYALDERGMLDAVPPDMNRYTDINIETGVFYQQKRNPSEGTLSAEVIEDSHSWVEEIWHCFLRFRDRFWDDLDGASYAEAIDEYVEKWGWTDDESLQFLDALEEVIETEYAADSSRLSVRAIEFFPPGYATESRYVAIPGAGFGNVAAKYAEPYADRVRPNAKVTEIDTRAWAEGGGRAVVRCTEDGEEREVRAKAVLVTVSLGVLKAGTIEFVPPLPLWEQEAIDETGFGVVNKCLMSWDDDAAVVWPRDTLWLLLTTPEDETSGLWSQFYNPTSLKGRPSLTAWVGGDEALAEEERTDEEILAHVMANLRSMFPHVRDPDIATISRWGKEEHVRGTYSFPKMGRDFWSDRKKLSRAVGNVWFAGEATSSGWATTVGAWSSGEDRALEMLEHLRSGGI